MDVGGGHPYSLAQPTGGERDGSAAAQALTGGKQAVLVHCAHIPLDRYGHGGKIPKGGAAPVGAGYIQLDLLARLDRQRGQGGVAARLGDLKLGQPVHHMDLGAALQVAGGKAQLVGAGAVPGGVGAAVDRAQTAKGGVAQVPQAGGDRVERLVYGGSAGQSR